MNAAISNMIADVLHQHGVQHAVICPGSRSAPLVLAFARHAGIHSYTISDERAAGFYALGMAAQSGQPVALVCTSGSAGYNFAPAVAEAFYSQVPLIVLTADRPEAWIDQRDGQTIRQHNLFGEHVAYSRSLPQDYNHPDHIWHANRVVNEAMIAATQLPGAPVHLNISFREPLYETSSTIGEAIRIIRPMIAPRQLSQSQIAALGSEMNGKNILVVAGQMRRSPELQSSLQQFCSSTGAVVTGDILSNLHGMPEACLHADTFLGALTEDRKHELAPDLVITIGQSLVAKNVKLLLRKFRPKAHWHVGPESTAADTFQSLTRIIQSDPIQFFAQPGNGKSSSQYSNRWLQLEKKTRAIVQSYFMQRSSEFGMVAELMKGLAGDVNLHLANSMAVRYANHIGLTQEQANVEVWSNRGTSGIDGCTSTAMGHALLSPDQHVLITGDQAFFYDRNAFWNPVLPKNLGVLVLNNHGGLIFSLIDGPAGLPEEKPYFTAPHNLSIREIAIQHQLRQVDATFGNLSLLSSRGDRPTVMETSDTQESARAAFSDFKKTIHQNL